MARAALMGLGSTRVEFARCVLNRENLTALSELLVSGDVRAVVGATYPVVETTNAIAHMLGHHARGNIAITV